MIRSDKLGLPLIFKSKTMNFNFTLEFISKEKMILEK